MEPNTIRSIGEPLRKLCAVEAGRSRTAPRQRATLENSRSRETRVALIRAAAGLWNADGDFDAAYQASTAADIARAAGVSKGTFYFHFANKEQILLEMTSTTVRKMIDQIEADTARDVPLDALSDQVMSAMARRVARGPRLAAMRSGTLGFAARSEEGAATATRLSVAFESLLSHGKQRGDLDAEVDVEEGAAMLTAVTMEAIIRWGAGADLSAVWLDKTLRERVAVVLRGIG
jgi:AcrR family transcriptional regulator